MGGVDLIMPLYIIFLFPSFLILSTAILSLFPPFLPHPSPETPPPSRPWHKLLRITQISFLFFHISFLNFLT